MVKQEMCDPEECSGFFKKKILVTVLTQSCNDADNFPKILHGCFEFAIYFD